MVRDEGKSITYVVEVSPKHDVYYAENADQLNYRAENILFEMEAALVNETDTDQDVITVEIPKMLNIETVSLFAEEDYIFEEYNI